MENSVSQKIRLLLNELAILNQPEIADGNFIYELNTLERIKSLCSELYLLSDIARQGRVLPVSHLQPVVKSQETVTPVSEESLPLINVVEEVNETVTEAEVAEETGTTVVEKKTELPVITETVPEIVEDAIPAPPKISDPVKKPGTDLATKISLTRRFEYINNLFAGNAADFSNFLEVLSAEGSVTAAMEMFDREFENRSWRKKSESAQDLRNLIKKLLQAG